MTINSGTGEISWTPVEAQLGPNPVTVEASNGEEPNATQSFNIAVLFLDNFDDNKRSAMWRLSIENYDKARVVEEANQLNVMAASQMDLVSSCVGHWKMNDIDDQNQVDDSSGNDNHGTAQQITSLLHTDSNNPPYLNGALTFNGTSDYITTPMTNFPSGSAARSASLWIKWDGSTGYSVIFGYGDDATGIKLFGAFLDPTGNLYCWNDYQNPANNHDTGIDIAIGDWTHIVLTYDGTNVRAYKDGASVDTTAKALDTVLEESTIGKNIWAGLHHFAGSIDNVMIFDKELSQDEISYLYNNGNGTETMPGNLFTSDYIANGWSFDVNEDFALEVDFHYGSVNDQDGWVGIAVENDDSYFSISAGSDSNESYFYYESIVDGNTVFEQEARDSNDGTLYISYEADSNNVYLSHTGYGDANAYVWQTAPDPLQGQSANVVIGGGSAGVALGLGDAYLDNFAVTTAALLGWPPATDLDSDGFIGWGDVRVMSQYWLDISPGDINGDGIVNFKDLAELGLAW